jgi:hypothetical protein
VRIPDIDLTPPQFPNSPEATRDMAIYTAKLVDILQNIYENLQTIPVVASAPVITQLQETGNPDGSVKSDLKILDDATQTNRKLYYRFQDNLRVIDSA